jgi:acetyl-CoA C-acetyltransferase
MLFQRPDISTSQVMQAVMKNTLAMANVGIDEIDLIDIYSCFPCAVSTVCEALDLPTDGSRALTLTGGLPFFGGPGNNYSMHGLAEMSQQLRDKPDSKGLLTANGGFLSKHAAIVLSRQAAKIDWQAMPSHTLATASFPSMPEAGQPDQGTVLSYTVQYKRGVAQQVVIIGEDNGERFIATNNDQAAIARCEASSPIGAAVTVSSHDSVNTFEFLE